jgi:hypothetical protein
MSMKVAWNRNKTASVVLSKLKEFTVLQNATGNKFSARGWFNKDNSFVFGDDFDTLTEAQKYLENIFKLL